MYLPRSILQKRILCILIYIPLFCKLQYLLTINAIKMKKKKKKRTPIFEIKINMSTVCKCAILFHNNFAIGIISDYLRY